MIGKRLALTIDSGNNTDIGIYDWQRDAMSRLTFSGGRFYFPVWSPDSRYVVLGGGGIFWTRADGAGKPQPLTQSKNAQLPFSFSHDGKRLAFMQINPASPYDLWTVPVQNRDGQLKAGKPEVYLQMSVMVREAAFSPDGRWIAYGSQESGSNEIYVRSFPDKGGKWQISNSGGTIPIWSPSGGELFYYSEDRRIMVVNYTAKGDSFLPNKPRLWSETQLADTGVFQNYDIAPDGKRFVVLMPAEGSDKQESQSHVTFLLNFFDELRRRIPTEAK